MVVGWSYIAQWQSTGGYNQTAWVRFPTTAWVLFFSKKSLLGSRWGDDICGALVQFGCYHHSVKGIRSNPVIKSFRKHHALIYGHAVH